MNSRFPASATAGLAVGQKPRSHSLWNKRVLGLCEFRDQFSLFTWMLMGAILQASIVVMVLLQLPASARTNNAHLELALAPVFVIAGYKILRTVVQVSSYRPGISDNAVLGRVGGTLEKDPNSDGGICLFILGAECNHPLGILAPGYRDIGYYFDKMVADLEAHSESYGFLGYDTCLETTSTRNNGIRMHHYFKTYEGLRKFAHSEMHKKGWNWWNGIVKQHPHLGIFHEVYHSPAGHWEAIYGNYKPSGLGATTFPYLDGETGEKQWRAPMELANSGRLRTSLGRMMRGDGGDNDHIRDAIWDVDAKA